MFSKLSQVLDLVYTVVHSYEYSKLKDRLPLDIALKVSYEPLVKTKVKSSMLNYSGEFHLFQNFWYKKNRKKGVYILMKRSRDSYTAGETPAVVKEYRTQLAAAFKRRGASLDVFLETNNETDFSVRQQTLFRIVKAIDEKKAPLSAEKKSGRLAKLMDM
jgi:hypothetical protein